jgi:CRP-like cAMP-binding protein
MKNTVTSERSNDRLLSDIFLELVPGLTPVVASSLASASEPRNYHASDLIISEGEPSTGIFLLASGTVRSVVSKKLPGAKKELNLQQITAPAVLGMTAAMLGQPSAVGIMALTLTETAFIPHLEFLRVLAQFPQTGLAFSQLMASELAHTYSRLSQLRSNARSARCDCHRRLTSA